MRTWSPPNNVPAANPCTSSTPASGVSDPGTASTGVTVAADRFTTGRAVVACTSYPAVCASMGGWNNAKSTLKSTTVNTTSANIAMVRPVRTRSRWNPAPATLATAPNPGTRWSTPCTLRPTAGK